jgi:hypothetical protein
MEEIGTNTGVSGIRGTPVVAMSENVVTQAGGTGRKVCMERIREEEIRKVAMRSANRRRMANEVRGGNTLSLERLGSRHNNHKVCMCTSHSSIPRCLTDTVRYDLSEYSNTSITSSPEGDSSAG